MMGRLRAIAVRPGDDQAAVRRVMLLVDNEVISREQALEALQMLGLVETPKEIDD